MVSKISGHRGVEMEKISLSGAGSRNWAADYNYSNPTSGSEKTDAKDATDPDQALVTAEGSKNEAKADKNGVKQEFAKEESLKVAERKKQELQQAKKKDEEKQAQQNLIQAFYLEKTRIDMSPEKLKESMKTLAERSIEHLMSRDGTSLKMEWKSELHKISLEISVEAYDKFNEQSDQQGEKDKTLAGTAKS